MIQPLAIVFYERIMPGSQIANRMQDLNYRVLTMSNTAQLASTTQRESPLLVIADMDTPGDVAGAITRIRTGDNTRHIPIIAFGPDDRPDLLDSALKCGARIAVVESALSAHLQTLLEQALQFD